MNHTRDIPQTFWRDDRLPWLELRSTWRSRQAYKRHSHPQLSVGAIIDGETRCLCNGQEYLLQPGDLIVIPPHAPHSCNPLRDQPRSYHMLYLEAAWCHAQRPDIPPTVSMASPQPLLRDSPLFACFQQIVALMSRGRIEQLPARVAQLLHALPLCAAAPQAPHHVSALLFQRLATDLPAPPSLDKLAHDSALRKETVIRAVKQDTGLTPASLINMARIEFAKTRLRAGDPIADVGYQAGFADQSHFHKTFVSYTAATPRQYAHSRSISDNK
ncbi:TPA: AraC family transcriptional regulator [Klebsiella quasipneumoniae subsp. similipneumoniae]|uniref:AraC family transcriptional regulator n=1 Tax=Klebsiella quasipneumoniae TaxID=1463165 RepID=UPI000808E053|nr:AraC family transcriptional regulator [Klebsiella quasipneumoniae]HBW2229402.1 AraC family transcriptional regulator [Klebsiella quasipneumoniae subsp. similipneumoniae]MEB6004010.1 AraC family transcriptional regulator [Klebsiella quasipneumoniae]SBZ74924.1 negative transcriptional regulator of cel operon [Klebsiella quasipneumoniae]SCA00581.1 negative transcriptional regulator of cel operon [Klebsiella quasipneumoniae]GKP51924.1 AraC family transcriptional regulator [Klebsiella quasipneum